MTKAFFCFILAIAFGLFTGIAFDLHWENTANAAGTITIILALCTFWYAFTGDEL